MPHRTWVDAPRKSTRLVARWTFSSARLRVLGLLLLAAVGVGCPCLRGAVNASPGLRWWLFSNFGAQQMCPEMVKRGAPLKLSPDGNTVGRFFPDRCKHDVNDSTQTVTIHFGGSGYAWTPLAGRIGFSVDASVEFAMDFWMGEDAIYIWARTRRIVYGPDFKIGSVENKVVDWAARSPAGYLASMFGSQIVQGQLSNGFTVVHTDEGDQFQLGILQPPARPKRPIQTSQGDRYVFVNEATDVRYDQVDFLGPFEVADTDQSLFLRMMVNGPPVDVFVIHRGNGDLWRDGLQKGMKLGPPPQPPITGFVLQPGQEMKQRFKLAPGQYFVVVDNSSRMGAVSPPWNPLAALGTANMAQVAYSAELGEDDDDEF
jgi:hypothetical protein